jgi:hypothetical protein
LALPSLRHQHPGRGPDQGRKDTGLGRFPSREYDINQAWLQIVALAADLTAWPRLLSLTGDLALVEPRLLRFKMLHVPARLSRVAGAGCLATGPGPARSSKRSGS